MTQLFVNDLMNHLQDVHIGVFDFLTSEFSVDQMTVDNLKTEGFSRLDTNPSLLKAYKCKKLGLVAEKLVESGYHESFLYLFDETWNLIMNECSRSHASTGLNIGGELVVNFRKQSDQGGFSTPHRDQVINKPNSFFENGLPKQVVVWIALTDALLETSCLYVIPKQYDEYHDSSLSYTHRVLGNTDNWINILALPAQCGESIVLSHRVIHWGSKMRSNCTRISLAITTTDGECWPRFLKNPTVIPPLETRLALIAGNGIKFQEASLMEKPHIRLFCELFKRCDRSGLESWFVQDVMSKIERTMFSIHKPISKRSEKIQIIEEMDMDIVGDIHSIL